MENSVISAPIVEKFQVSYGVNQGSHLGRELFVIFINDNADIVMASILLFANDSIFFITEDDVVFLQLQVSVFVNGAQSNFILLNVQNVR